jgi:hypothetical protein
MNKTIEQTIKFTGATAVELFDIYVKPEKHLILHGGAETKISAVMGKSFSLLNGNLNGKNPLIVPNRIIVQSWSWKENELDSILTLVSSGTKTGAQIHDPFLHSETIQTSVEAGVLGSDKRISCKE